MALTTTTQRPARPWSRWAAGLLVMASAAIGGERASRAAEPSAAARPAARNVVFIISDDQHWRDYGFQGHERLRTPRLDRLARESLVYPRGYVTSSLCSPSLATIITGRYPHEHRVVGNDPPEEAGVPRSSPAAKAAFAAGRERLTRHLEEWPTLPRLLGGHGFASLQTGKWWQGDHTRGGFTAGMTKGARHGDDGLAIGRATMQPVHDFITRCRREDRPFFVWYAPMLPHDPHDPERELVEHYATQTDSLHVARYWGNVERFDRTVGDLLDHLDREQVAADTLVVYVTDNGWIQRPDAAGFAVRSKLSPYDGGLRTPIMFRQPGTIRPASPDVPVSAVDIAPTVLAACGVPVPPGLPGVNLLDPVAATARNQVFGECYTHTLRDLDDPARSLLWRWTVKDRWKLIVPATADAGRDPPEWETRLGDAALRDRYVRGAVELYDVVADPDETRDVAAEQPDRVRDLRRSLDAWWSPGTLPGTVPGTVPGPGAGAGTAPAPGTGGATTARGPAVRPPNLVVFLADDLGCHDLGCTGSTFYRTPAIDRLAASGTLFTRGYAAAPVCSPTRAALLTGRHPARVRITNFIGGHRRGPLLPAEYLAALPTDEVTVAERLRDAGYATGVFGKWHLGPPRRIVDHGFDVVGSKLGGPGSGPPDDPHHARAIAAQASAFIRGSRDRPFFCYVPLHSPHVPLVTRPELAAEEGRRAVAVGPRFDLPAPPAADPVTRRVQDHPVYAGMIREMDETVAAVLAAIDEAGRAGETLVVFTSDNGGLSTAEGAPTSNLPLRAGKGFLYEGGIRVPLVVRWPGVLPAGGTSAVPVTTLDVAVTLLDAAGILPAEATGLDGLSLRPLGGGGPPPARDLVWHYPHYSNQGARPAAAILAGDGPRPGSEKLVEHFEDGRLELYDLSADPGERSNLAAERPERTAALRERLEAWRRRTAAALPTANPRPVDPFGPEGEPPASAGM